MVSFLILLASSLKSTNIPVSIILFVLFKSHANINTECSKITINYLRKATQIKRDDSKKKYDAIRYQSSTNFSNLLSCTHLPPLPIEINSKNYKKCIEIENIIVNMCILTTLFIVVCSTVVLKLLWLIRMGTLAHWSFIIGKALSPKDTPGHALLLGGAMFCFITLGTLMPTFLCPRLKFIATALTIPPQFHMILLLYKNITRRVENETVLKTVQAYTVASSISMIWTIVSLLRY